MPVRVRRKHYSAKAAADTFLRDWRLYVYEGAELAIFMIAACACTVLLFGSARVIALLPQPVLRRVCMGVAMGLTAVFIIHTPMGKRSGAHFNPAITLTYLRLGKIGLLDAGFYVLGQFAGGVAGVGIAALLLGRRLAAPAVNYAVTVPGVYGTAAAFAAEFFMAALLMGVVLLVSNRPTIARYTSYCVGCLIAVYIVLFAPVSGFSINPARTVGSAVFAHLWTALWLYFTATAGRHAAGRRGLRQSQGQSTRPVRQAAPRPRLPMPIPLHLPRAPSLLTFSCKLA